MSPIRGEGSSRNRRELHPAGFFRNPGTLCTAGELALPVLQIWNLGHSAASPPPLEDKLISPRVSERERGRQEKMF